MFIVVVVPAFVANFVDYVCAFVFCLSSVGCWCGRWCGLLVWGAGVGCWCGLLVWVVGVGCWGIRSLGVGIRNVSIVESYILNCSGLQGADVGEQ